MTRTGRLKGVTHNGDIVGFILVNQRKMKEFTHGIYDVEPGQLSHIMKMWVGQRVTIEGGYHPSTHVGYIQAFSVGLAKVLINNGA